MQDPELSFSIRVTRSRLTKGLLAIPAKHRQLFPSQRCEVKLLFDDEVSVEPKVYVPDGSKVKERRIFGLGRWFARHGIKPGDRLTITVVDRESEVYRLTLDRHSRLQREKQVREALIRAPSDETARARLQSLAEVTKRGRRRAAKEVLLEIARESGYPKRLRQTADRSSEYRTVAPAVRVLLGELHQGKCQVCSFTFRKKNGDPYFEVHHLDADVGDHPANLLVVCPNCHAQFEHANVGQIERIGGWVVSVRINGKRFTIRQPFRRERLEHIDSIVRIMLVSLHSGLAALTRLRM